MTEVEREEIKARLIALGFWGEDEPGDPTVAFLDAITLHNRVAARLIKDHFQVSTWVGADSPSRTAQAVCGQNTYELATADTYPECVCLASLALPDFLKEHPECAAD